MSSPFPPAPANPDPFNFGSPPPNTGYGPPQFASPAYGPPKPPSTLSMPALFSLILAVVSPFSACVCTCLGLPYVTAIIALGGIVMGHIGLSRIGKSGGALSGSGLAIGGLVIGYPMLLLGLIFSSFLFLPKDFGKRAPGYEETPAGRLDAAESKINTDSEGIAHGNTPEAKALAKKYATTMKTLREALFTKGKKGISLSGGNFITYCELHDGRCAFITHVPQYRKFTDDAKESLAEIAWEAAQETVADSLHAGDELGVGLKGVVVYGAVMVGHVTIAGDEKRGLEKESELDESLLEPFFEIDPEEIPKEPPIKLDDPAKPVEPDKAAEPDKPAEPAPPNAESPSEESKP